MAGFRVALAAVAASVIAGCATLPEFREDPLTTADVVRHIKCELRDAAYAYPGNEWVQKWKATFTLTLDVQHDGTLDLDATWVFPLNLGGLFSINPTGRIFGQGTRTERINWYEAIDELNGVSMPWCSGEEPGRFARLGGKLGIADLLERVALSMKVANIRTDHLSNLDYDLDFQIKKTGSLLPRFAMIPIGKEKTFTGFPKWTANRQDKQTLKMVLKAPEKEDRACTLVPDGEPWPDPKKCPNPYYLVKAKPACHILNEPDCGTRTEDCVWTKKNGKPACDFACFILGDQQLCSQRADCTWNKRCEPIARPKGAPRDARRAFELEAAPRSRPPYVVRSGPPTASSPGLSQSDKDGLDRARGRSVLDSIDAELRRQNINR